MRGAFGRAVPQRNGYRSRTAQLSYQVVEIRIPRLRGQGFVPSFFEPGHRAVAQVESWVEKALLASRPSLHPTSRLDSRLHPPKTAI